MKIEELKNALIDSEVYSNKYYEGLIEKVYIENDKILFDINFIRPGLEGVKRVEYDNSLVFDFDEDRENKDVLVNALSEINGNIRFQFGTNDFTLLELVYHINSSMNGIQLLSEIYIDETEYNLIFDYLKNKPNFPASGENNPTIALFMVYYWIYNYNSNNRQYWTCLERDLINSNSNKKFNKKYFFETFKKTVQDNGLYFFNGSDQDQIVENIKIHSFILNDNFIDYYEFVESFYNNTLKKDIFIYNPSIVLGMQNSLKKTQDDDGLIISKKYNLLKYTKRALANLNYETLKKFFYYSIQCFDDYRRYDNSINESSNRYDIYFKKFLEAKRYAINSDKSIVKKRRKHNFKPYLKYNVKNEAFELIIPRQSFPKECIDDIDAFDSVEILVKNNNSSFSKNIRVYESYDNYIFEDGYLSFEITNIFSDIITEFVPVSILNSIIKKSKYRLFDDNWEEIKNLKQGDIYLVIPKNTNVKFENCDLKCNYSILSEDIICYSLFLYENSSIYIDGIKMDLSQDDYYLDFKHEISNVTFSVNDNSITASREHPQVVLNISNDEIKTGVISVNDKYKFNLRSAVNYEIFSIGNNKSQILLNLDDKVPQERNKYIVKFDSKKTNNRVIGEYLLLPFFNILFEKPRYIYEKNGNNISWFKIKKPGLDIALTNEYECAYEDLEYSTFNFKVSDKVKEIEVFFSIGTLNIKAIREVKKVEIGNSINNTNFEKSNEYWYIDLQSTIFFKFPGIKSLSFCIDIEKEKNIFENIYSKKANLVENDIYTVNINDFLEKIEKNDISPFNYRNYWVRLQYEDNKTRNIKNYFKIKRINFLKPYYPKLIKDGDCLTTTIEKIEGNGKIVLSLFDENNNCIDKRESFNEGEVLSFKNIDFNKKYTLSVDQVERNLVYVKTTHVCDASYSPTINYLNLENKILYIKKILKDGKEIPFNSEKMRMNLTILNKKNNNSYYGYIYDFNSRRKYNCEIIIIRIENPVITCVFNNNIYYSLCYNAIFDTYNYVFDARIIGKNFNIIINNKKYKEKKNEI